MFKKTTLAIALLAMSGTVLAADPVLLSAVSRKVHGTAGTFDIVLNADIGYVEPVGVVEPRTGPYYNIVFTWNQTIDEATCIGASSGPVYGEAIVQGNTVTCPLYVPYNGTWALLNVLVETHNHRYGEALTKIGFLVGDVNGDYTVTVADKALVNAQLAQYVTVNNFKADVNANGYLAVSDVGITNARIGTFLPE